MHKSGARQDGDQQPGAQDEGDGNDKENGPGAEKTARSPTGVFGPVGNPYAEQSKREEKQDQRNKVGKVHFQTVLGEKSKEKEGEAELKFAEKRAEGESQNGEAASQPPGGGGESEKKKFAPIRVEEPGDQCRPGFRLRNRRKQNLPPEK